MIDLSYLLFVYQAGHARASPAFYKYLTLFIVWPIEIRCIFVHLKTDNMSHHFSAKLATLLAFFLTAFGAIAQSSDEPVRHWQVHIEASTYNTLDWGLELGIHYYPVKYVGVGAALGLGSNFNGGEKVMEMGSAMVKTDKVDNAAWFSTGIQLQSPALWSNQDGDLQLKIKADAGISLPFPTNSKVGYVTIPNQPGTYVEPPKEYERNHGGESCYLYFKPAVALDIDRCQVWAGYSLSNMDAYSSVRNVTIMGHPLDLPRKKTMHGISLGFGFRF